MKNKKNVYIPPKWKKVSHRDITYEELTLEDFLKWIRENTKETKDEDILLSFSSNYVEDSYDGSAEAELEVSVKEK
jgi:hypothetical protein